MKRLFLALALALLPSLAWAQCSGVFPPNTLCGNMSGVPQAPTAVTTNAVGNVIGPNVSVNGDIAVWNNITGTLLKDIPPLQIFGTQSANTFLVGPTSGGAAFPTWRILALADYGTQSANAILAGPTSGGSATPTWRALVNADFSTMPNNTVKGNISGGAAIPSDLTQLQLTALVNTFTSSLSGTAPASGGGASNFLRADGSWSPPTPTVATIAALKALTAPSNQVPIYVEGYIAFADGGEGWFEYCTTCTGTDNGGTLLIPNSAPGTGRWIRSHVATTGNDINVKWFGAKGDGTTIDTTAVGNALAVAISIHGGLYFPSSTGCYITTIDIPDGTDGLRLHGDTSNYSTIGSCIRASGTTFTIRALATSGGSIGNLVFEDLFIVQATGSGDAVALTNLLFLEIKNCVIEAFGTGTGLNIIGTGNFGFADNQIYGAGGAALRIVPSGSTNSGPGVISGGELSIQGGGSTNCVVISGQTLGVVFQGNQFSCQGPNMVASVTIDGDGVATNQAGEVTFIQPHSESSYNTANTGADFLIGNTNAFGMVSIIGGSMFGQGNGTNFLRDSVRVVAARSVSIRDYNMTSLGSGTGYSRAGIRLETTFTGQYSFTNNFVDAGKTLYSDASGVLAAAFFGSAIYDGTTAKLSASVVSGSAIAITSNVAITITSITLTPGDWDVKGTCGYASGGGGTTSVTRASCSLGVVTNALDTTLGRFVDISFPAFVPAAGSGQTIQVAPELFSVAVNTTVYVIAFSIFTVSTNTAYGKISAARRVFNK